MLVFRSFAIGLSAACFALLVTTPAVQVRVAHEHVHVAAPRGAPALPAPSIIDVAPGVTPSQLAAMLRLTGGERITSIDDAPVAGDLGAGIVLAQRELRSRQFIDLGVAGPAGERRVLVLLH